MEANGILDNIQSQISSCRELLSVFQEERKVYQEGGVPGKAQMAETLMRKKRLVELFDGQRELLRRIGDEEKDSPEAVKEQKKALMRELASVLEQLLVIDLENERLLKEASCTVRRPVSDTAVAARHRPSLQRQLPLMPFDRRQAASEARPTRVPAVQPPPSRKDSPVAAPSVKPAGMPVRPRAHLREYVLGASSRIMSQESKYA